MKREDISDFVYLAFSGKFGQDTFLQRYQEKMEIKPEPPKKNMLIRLPHTNAESY